MVYTSFTSMMAKRFLGLFLLLIGALSVSAQTVNYNGVVLDQDGEPLQFVNVIVEEYNHIWDYTDEEGRFSLAIPEREVVHIIYSSVSTGKVVKEVKVEKGEVLTEEVILDSKAFVFEETDVYGHKERAEISTVKISVKEAQAIPNANGGIESILVAQALGVQKNNELSSAYSVRGGNYDENLVYVNDFEVYRPFLIRSGQQEGLSFVNGDLIDNISFSSGGFQTRYGDKMASVLDVTYKRPKEFHGSFSASLLGGTAHIEGANKNERFTFALGVRNKTSRYLLGSQDVKGQYSPAFVDIQTFLTYRISDRAHIEYIANYSRNKFDFIPEDRSTDFGLINFQTRFTVDYDGEENDKYQSFMNGFAFVHKPNSHLQMKWMASSYLMREEEKFDIIGTYSLGEVETDPSKENAGEVKYELGNGTFHDWARNELYTKIYSAAHKGSWYNENHGVKWGLTYKREQIEDKINEWERLDSAGYSLPYNPQEVVLYDVLKAEPFDLNSNRYSGYLQHTWYIGDSSRASINYGARFTYWDVNNEFLVSPRMQLSYKPKTKKDLVFTAAAGMYQQPPFYREMRNLEGEVNLDLKAQKSAHFVLGMDYAFEAWNRPFRFTTEAYYKYLWDLVPYEFDNVLIRYFGENNSRGYAAGIDLRLHGELAKDAESWVSLSLMSTQEDILDDYYTEYIIEKTKEENNGQTISDVTDTLSANNVFPGYLARPTDQRLSFAVFFQDYIPKFPYLKVHMNLIFATGLPFGPPNSERYQDQFRIPAYRRFDVGFSALLFDYEKKIEKGKVPKSFFKHVDKIWLSLEVYNLFGIQNTVSYYWVNGLDVRTGKIGQYAVPNYLTDRRVNLRFKVDF